MSEGLWAELTFLVWHAFSSKPPLNQNPYEAQNRANPSDGPVEPAERTQGGFMQHIIHLVWQDKRPHQVIDAQHHSRCSKHRRVDDAEQFLPLQREDRGTDAGSQYGTDRQPHRGEAVEVSDNHQDGEAQQAPQLQATEDQPRRGHQHGHQAAEHRHPQTDPCFGLQAQLGVQHRLLLTQQEDGCGAKREAREEHDHFEAAVSWRVEDKCLTGRSRLHSRAHVRLKQKEMFSAWRCSQIQPLGWDKTGQLVVPKGHLRQML